MAKQISEWDDEPELARIFRDGWPAMVSEKRQELLNEFVVRITYNNDGEVGFEMNKEAVARFVEEQNSTSDEGE